MTSVDFIQRHAQRVVTGGWKLFHHTIVIPCSLLRLLLPTQHCINNETDAFDEITDGRNGCDHFNKSSKVNDRGDDKSQFNDY